MLLVGAVEQAAPGSVQIRTSDNGNVTIQTTAPPDYSNSEIVEFDVNVTGPNIVQENSHTRLSSGFGAFGVGCILVRVQGDDIDVIILYPHTDMENYEELVKLIHEHGRTILLP